MPQMSAPRRAVQACSTCRNRKTRCDAKVPKCSLCVDLNVECQYAEPQGPRIDANTRLLLERIQHLEDRIFSQIPLWESQLPNILLPVRGVDSEPWRLGARLAGSKLNDRLWPSARSGCESFDSSGHARCHREPCVSMAYSMGDSE